MMIIKNQKKKNTASVDTLYNYSESEDEDEEEENLKSTPEKKQKPYSPVIVKSAFENTKETIPSSDETIPSSDENSKIEEYEVDDFFRSLDLESIKLMDLENYIRLRSSFRKSPTLLTLDIKNKINDLLLKFGKISPSKGIKNDDKFLQKVKQILIEDDEIRFEREKQKRIIKDTKKLKKKSLTDGMFEPI